jgi:hypothetical protein
MADIEADESDEMVGVFETDEADEREAAERSWRIRSPVRTATGRGIVQPQRPAQGNVVTQAQLQAALAGIANQIRTNSDAINTVNTKVSSMSKDLDRLNIAIKKEAERRKKSETGLSGNVSMAMLLPALMQKTVGPTQSALDGIPAGTKLVAASDTISLLLPMMLMGGLGSPEAGAGGMDNMTMLLLVLAISGNL